MVESGMVSESAVMSIMVIFLFKWSTSDDVIVGGCDGGCTEETEMD